MRYWIITEAPLKDDGNLRKLLTLPKGAIVKPTGRESMMFYLGKRIAYREIVYFDGTKEHQGWVYSGYLESYFEEFPTDVVKIRNATPYPNDGAQYLTYRGNVQYNLCGEMCVCHCAGWDLDVESFLDAWATKALSVFQRIFLGNKSRGTGLVDLDSMFSVFEGYTTPALRLGNYFYDDVAKLTLITPGKMAGLLQSHKVIMSVRIDPRFGNLQVSGVLHWVVVHNVIPDGIGRGFVELYNPFPNRRQRYSWQEFMASAGVPYGVAVERN
jgi:hypothetical protein